MRFLHRIPIYYNKPWQPLQYYLLIKTFPLVMVTVYCLYLMYYVLPQAAAANPFMGMGDPQPVTASPARPPPPAHPPQPKSAFDDLEDVMRMSLGGSPAKQPQPITQQPQPMAAQPFGDVMSMPVAQPMMFGSPARQPMMPMAAMGSKFKI